MTISGKAGKIGFVAASAFLSAVLTYGVCQNIVPQYKAELYFQMASVPGAQKPDVNKEKDLLQSNSILIQVLRDTNLVASSRTGRFRSFDLGPKYQLEKPLDPLQVFKNHVSVQAFPESSVIGITYEGGDQQQARKIVEDLFEKYRDWRQSQSKPGFDAQTVSADQVIVIKREAFLQAQKAFLDFTENQNTEDAAASLNNQRALVESKIASLKLRYGPKHPAMLEAMRELEALKVTAVATPDPSKIKALREAMERNFQDLDMATRKSVKLEQEKSRPAFEIMQVGEIQVTSSLRENFITSLLAGLAGFILSLLYLNIRKSPVFTSSESLEKETGFPCLVKIPGLPASDTNEVQIPAGGTAEAFKALRQELKLRSSDTAIKLVTITATSSDEGRSEMAVSLGRMAARAGELVLVLDADLRSPTLQQKLPLKMPRNIVDYLSGQARLDDIINRTDPSGLHVIYGTSIPNTALDLISSEKMKTLLFSLREAYDLVIVQAPPSPRGPDARVLAAASDKVLYAVKAGKTSRKELKAELLSFYDSTIKNIYFALT